jgi:hypothetical protein
VHQKSKVTVSAIITSGRSGILSHRFGQITGRKENAEEAKKRILNQLERLVSLSCTSLTLFVLISSCALFRRMKPRKYSRFRASIIPRSSVKVVNTRFGWKKSIPSRSHSLANLPRMGREKRGNSSNPTRFSSRVARRVLLARNLN